MVLLSLVIYMIDQGDPVVCDTAPLARLVYVNPSSSHSIIADSVVVSIRGYSGGIFMKQEVCGVL